MKKLYNYMNEDELIEELLSVIPKDTAQPAPQAIPLERLHRFPNHPYKVEDNEEMNTLVQSIREQGILTPLLVRHMDGSTTEYEVISGHRRAHAAKLAGLETVPAFVVAMDRNAATIALVDSNLHRERLLPSEKAFAYKLKMEALKQQGRRTDLTSDQVGPKLTADEISDSDSATQVKRYIHLTRLIPALLDRMDEGKIAFSVGVELSYLDEDMQRQVLGAMDRNDCTLAEEKPNQKEQIRLKRENYAKYFPSYYTNAQIEQDIQKGLELLRRQRERSREAQR